MQADAHTLAVDQMRLGDHAFAHYGDDNVRWHVPAAFTQDVEGVMRREKTAGGLFASRRYAGICSYDRLHARTLRHLGAARIGRLVLDELAEDR